MNHAVGTRGSYPDRSFLRGDSRPRGGFREDLDIRRLKRLLGSVPAAESTGSGETIQALRSEFRARGQQRDTLARVFHLAATSVRAQLGFEPSIGEFRLAAAMLAGRAVECESLTARRTALLLAACAASLGGEPVHVLCAAAKSVSTLFDTMSRTLVPLGIDVATVSADHGAAARRRAYRADVVITTSREVALDHLRDSIRWPDRQGGVADRLDRLYGARSRSGSLLMTGLHWALFDRLDQCLIDEARIPVVIGHESQEPFDRQFLSSLYEFSASLEIDADFLLDPREGVPRLTSSGVERAAVEFPGLFDPWTGADAGPALLVNALRVRYLLVPGRHYQRQGDRIVIPGLLPGQASMTAHDLLQLRRLLECRETGARVVTDDVAARITYLALFRKYHRLGGTASSVRGVERELLRLYGLHARHARESFRGRHVVRRRAVLQDVDGVVEFIAARHEPAIDGRQLVIAVVAGAGDQDQVLDGLRRRGCRGAGDLFDEAGEPYGVKLVTLRDFLPSCADAGLFRPFGRVDVCMLCLPTTLRHVRECEIPTLNGENRGAYWQLMTVRARHEQDALQAPPPLPQLGFAATLGIVRPLVGISVRAAIRSRERAEARTRAATLSHQTSIDELFAFSGRGRT